MAKQTKNQKTSNKSFKLYIILAVVLVAGWWMWKSDETANWRDRFLEYVDNQEISTLESRYLAEQVIAAHRQELVGQDHKKIIQNTFLNYYPYLLLDIKYTAEDQTPREGVMLWGMNDGEIVLNTDTWEKTHGFRDCFACRAVRSDFKVMIAIAKRKGLISLDEMQKELHVERDVLEKWVEAAKQKHLIVQKGNNLQLHFENPKLLVSPQTKINQPIVVKPQGEGTKVERDLTKGQIIAMAQEAFGSDLKIREEREVFLPVYAIEILNPDGSIHVSEWNSLTGQKITPNYMQRNR